mmetsp:Transcript_12870/g.32126  ORF Transcript_12870/g.32126 Transcript_12870/m.32126 type:complete len:449 (-) Transcript_12870:629-1975(-)
MMSSESLSSPAWFPPEVVISVRMVSFASCEATKPDTAVPAKAPRPFPVFRALDNAIILSTSSSSCFSSCLVSVFFPAEGSLAASNPSPNPPGPLRPLPPPPLLDPVKVCPDILAAANGPCFMASASSSFPAFWLALSMFSTKWAANLLSPLVSNVYASPSMPARPVRPIRWVCVSISRAASWQITVRIVEISRPRAATSVAMSTWAWPFLNLNMTTLRSPCSKSPWMATVSISKNSLMFVASSSTTTLDFAKTSTCPLDTIPGSLSDIHVHFASSSLTTTACWTTLSAAFPTEPTVIRTGFFRVSRARCSIFGGNVAEKSKDCLSGRMLLQMLRTCPSKPIDNIRSASSSTKYVERAKLVAFICTRSIRRPGAAVTISQPLFRSFHWSLFDMPPPRTTFRMLNLKPNLVASRSICTASSRVGQRITPIGPSSLARSLWSITCTIRGNK